MRNGVTARDANRIENNKLNQSKGYAGRESEG